MAVEGPMESTQTGSPAAPWELQESVVVLKAYLRSGWIVDETLILERNEAEFLSFRFAKMENI
jgi:hypothetical protein